jgi:hypothetical protein
MKAANTTLRIEKLPPLDLNVMSSCCNRVDSRPRPQSILNAKPAIAAKPWNGNAFAANVKAASRRFSALSWAESDISEFEVD